MSQHSRNAIAYLNVICPTADFYLHHNGETLCADMLGAEDRKLIGYLADRRIIAGQSTLGLHTTMLTVSDDLSTLRETAMASFSRRNGLYESNIALNTILKKAAGVSVIFDGQFLSGSYRPSIDASAKVTQALQSLQLAKSVSAYDLDLQSGRLTILAADPACTQCLSAAGRYQSCDRQRHR